MGMRKLFAIISISIFALLFVGLFLPYVGDGYGGSISLWDGYGETLKIFIILELLIGAVICGLTLGDVTSDFKFAGLCAGYNFTAFIVAVIDAMKDDLLSYYEYGLWVNLLLSIAAVVIIIVGNVVKDEPIKKEVKMNMQTNMNNNRMNQNMMNNNYNPNMNNNMPPQGYGNPNMNGVFGGQGMNMGGNYPNQGMNNNMQGGYPNNQGYNNYNNRFR